MRLTTLVENKASRPDLCAEHGLSVLVENGTERLLFDTGQTDCLIHNLEALDIDPAGIDRVVLSHGHYDHAGGLPSLSAFTRPVVYAHPEIFRRRYAAKGQLRYIGIKNRNFYEQQGVRFVLSDQPTEVIADVHTTGYETMATPFEIVDKGFVYETDNGYAKDNVPDDQSLVLNTPRGLFVLFGCAHRGIINIMRQSEQRFGKKVFGFMGGTHLGAAEEDQLRLTIDALKTMDLEVVAPLHCTGTAATARLAGQFGDRFMSLNGGSAIAVG